MLQFDRAVTVFVGDTGSGRSTLLEGVAVHQCLNAEGGSRGMQFRTRDDTVSNLHEHLRVLRSPTAPRDAFFLRAESYFNVATALEDYFDKPHELAGSYGAPPHVRSHGESFIDLVVHRFRPRGLYFLDEPEAALSVHGQLQLLVRMHDLIDDGCQFVFATHSPLLMAYPGATIYEFSERGVEPVEWRDINTVRITREFLDSPDQCFDELFRDDD